VSSSAADEFADFVGSVPFREIRLPWGTTQVWDIGQGRPLVAIHGISGGRRMLYRFVAAAIARRRRVIVAPLRGEDVPALDRSPEPYLDDIAALLAEFGLSEVTLFGMSFGGYLALAYGARNDPRVRDICIQGGFPRYRLSLADRISLRGSYLLPAAFGTWYFKRRTLRGREHRLLAQALPGLETMVADWTARTPFASIRARSRMIDSHDLRGRVHAIEDPLTMAHGRLDTIVPFRALEVLRELRPDARPIAFDDAGHNIYLTHPDRIADLVGD